MRCPGPDPGLSASTTDHRVQTRPARTRWTQLEQTQDLSRINDPHQPSSTGATHILERAPRRRGTLPPHPTAGTALKAGTDDERGPGTAPPPIRRPDPIHPQTQPTPYQCVGFRRPAHDPGELQIEPLLVVADQRPEHGVDCLGTERRPRAHPAGHRGITTSNVITLNGTDLCLLM